jgi:hypothetical protein
MARTFLAILCLALLATAVVAHGDHDHSHDDESAGQATTTTGVTHVDRHQRSRCERASTGGHVQRVAMRTLMCVAPLCRRCVCRWHCDRAVSFLLFRFQLRRHRRRHPCRRFGRCRPRPVELRFGGEGLRHHARGVLRTGTNSGGTAGGANGTEVEIRSALDYVMLIRSLCACSPLPSPVVRTLQDACRTFPHSPRSLQTRPALLALESAHRRRRHAINVLTLACSYVCVCLRSYSRTSPRLPLPSRVSPRSVRTASCRCLAPH